MTVNQHKRTPNIFPFLRYKDATAAVEWLVSAFGFEKLMVAAGPNGTVGHAELRLGPGVIMLASVRDDELGMKSPRDLPALSQGVYVYVEDIRTHYDRTKAAGAEIVYALRETEYDSSEYAARDLEGHLWSFGTYSPMKERL